MAGFDFDAARKAGYSDDEILDFVSKDDSGVGVKIDLDGARKAGYTARDIIDHLKDAGVAPKDTSYGGALRHSASEALRGLGQTLETFGATDLGPSFKKTAADIAPKNYQPGMDQVMNPQPGDTTVNPGKYVQPVAKTLQKVPYNVSPSLNALGRAYGWAFPDKEYGVRELPRAAVEGAVPMATDVGAGAAGTLAGGPVGGFMAAAGSYTARNAGDRIQARAANNGRTEPSTMDKIIGTGVAGAEGALNAVPAGRIASPGRIAGTGLRGVGEALGNVGTTAATGAGAGYGSSLLEQAGTTAGTDQGLAVDPKQALGSAVQSGATAAALASPRAIRREIPDAIRFREMGSDLLREGSARFANRLEDRADGDSLHNVHAAGRSFIEAEHDVMNELRAARRLVDLSTEGDNAVGRVERGLPLAPKDMRGLDRELAGQEGGGNLSSLVKEAVASQLLKQQGHVNTRSGTFAGGLAAQMRNFAKNRPGFAIALTGATGGATIPAYFALRAAASRYGLGTHSPAETFVSKFKDDTVPRVPPEVLPPQRSMQGPWGPIPPSLSTLPLGMPSVPPAPSAAPPPFGALHKPPPGFDMLLRAGVTSINREQRQADKAQTIEDRTRKQDESAGTKAGKGFARDLQALFAKEPPQPARKASPNDPVEAALNEIQGLKLDNLMNQRPPPAPAAPAAPPNTATAENPVEKALRSIANIKKSEPDGLLDTVARVARATNRVKSPDQQAATPKRERTARPQPETTRAESRPQPEAARAKADNTPPPVIEEIPVPSHLIHTEIDGRDKAVAAQAAHEFQQASKKPSHIVRRYEQSTAMRQARIRDRLMAISKDDRFPSDDMPLMESLDKLRSTRTREDLHSHIEDVASEQTPLVGALLRAYFSPKWAKSVWNPTQK